MNFDTTAKTTDIIMFNSRNLGALIVDERPHVREWDEPQFGIQNIAIEESYGFGVLSEGQAIAVAASAPTRSTPLPAPWSRSVRTMRPSSCRRNSWGILRSTSTPTGSTPFNT